MKRIYITLAAIAAIGLASVQAQTNTTTGGIAGGLEQLSNLFGGNMPTNITVGPFTTTTPKLSQWAWGIAGDWNLNQNIAFGAVIDSIPNRWTLFTGHVMLELPVYPLAWTKVSSLTNFVATPFTFAGIGSAFNSADSGGVTLVSAVGVNLPVVKVLGGEFCVAGWYENLTDAGKYSGNRIGICPNWHIDF